MAVETRGTASNYLQRVPSPSGLADARPPEALDERVQAAAETIRALRAAGVEDPFEGLRDDLRERVKRGETGEHEARELLLLAETLTALAAEAEALAVLQR